MKQQEDNITFRDAVQAGIYDDFTKEAKDQFLVALSELGYSPDMKLEHGDIRQEWSEMDADVFFEQFAHLTSFDGAEFETVYSDCNSFANFQKQVADEVYFHSLQNGGFLVGYN